MVRVCDLMHRGVIYCYPLDSAREVAKIMATNQIRAVVVVDETGEVWGLISIMELLGLYGQELEKIKAEEIMKPYKIEVDPQLPIESAIALMKRKKIDQLIIIDPHAGPKRPVGILTSFDIVQYMSGLQVGHYESQLKMKD